MSMPRLRLFPISLVVVWLTMFVSLSFAANAAAQEKGASEKPTVPAGPGGPSFTCGVCDDGYTPLDGAGWQICWRQAPQQGLVIQHVCFQQQTVLFGASPPFV